MGIFSRIGKLFGRQQKADIEQAEYQRMQAQKAAEVAKARAQQAKRLAEDAARQARELSSPTARAEAARRASLSRQAHDRREQEAKAEAQRKRQHAEDLERRAKEAYRKAVQARLTEEKVRSKAREALLETRADASDEDFYAAFKGPRPARKLYENVKPGTGDLPGKEEFLRLGVRYSAFASSNVEAMQFDPTTGDLYMCYLKGRHYRYRGVGRTIAAAMFDAASKGVASWDELRIRGTWNGNRYTTDKDVQPPQYLPLDTESSAGAFAAGGGGF